MTVRKAFNPDKLRDVCGAEEKTMLTDPKLRYFYKDNGAKILGVAHLDTVQGDMHFGNVVGQSTNRIFCPRLDDRLGVYTMLHMLPELKVKFDVLLTTGEESGNSSAKEFKTDKKYNWIFSFDRMGDDVVLYQYHSPENTKLLEKYGFRVSHGSYSDIASLGDLGVSGFNFGCGYHDYHSKWAYMEVSEYLSQVEKFLAFYHDRKDQRIAKPKEPNYKKWNYWSGSENYKGLNCSVRSQEKKEVASPTTMDSDLISYDKHLRKWVVKPSDCPLFTKEENAILSSTNDLLTWTDEGILCPNCRREIKIEQAQELICPHCLNTFQDCM